MSLIEYKEWTALEEKYARDQPIVQGIRYIRKEQRLHIRLSNKNEDSE